MSDAISFAVTNTEIFSSPDGIIWTGVYSCPYPAMSGICDAGGGVMFAVSFDGDDSYLHKSINYGSTWIFQGSFGNGYRPSSICFLGNNTLVCPIDQFSGDAVISRDLGVTWSNLNIIETKYCTSLGSGVALIIGNQKIIRTTDYFATFSSVLTLSPEHAFQCSRIVDLGGGILITVGYDVSAPTIGITYRSTDYGLTWTPKSYAIGTRFISVAYFGNGYAIASCANNTIYKSTDYGLNFTFDSTQGFAISNMLSMNSSIVLGNSSSIKKSDDNGLIWNEVSSETVNEFIGSLPFVPPPPFHGDFLPLRQTHRSWYGMAVAPNGDVYACAESEDIYKQTNGIGDFLPLHQTHRSWHGIAAAPNGDVYACADVDIYKQTGGVDDFISLGQTYQGVDWHSIAAAPNGNIYATGENSEWSGDIYEQTGGIGNFIRLGAPVSYPMGITVAPNGDVYVCDVVDIKKQTGGVGSFIRLHQAQKNWTEMAAAPNGDIYIQAGGTGDFIALGEMARNWYGIAAATNGDVYASVYLNGDIYKKTVPPTPPTTTTIIFKGTGTVYINGDFIVQTGICDMNGLDVQIGL
jgi:uncharacterized Zn-binding protein involved in type VI secretion